MSGTLRCASVAVLEAYIDQWARVHTLSDALISWFRACLLLSFPALQDALKARVVCEALPPGRDSRQEERVKHANAIHSFWLDMYEQNPAWKAAHDEVEDVDDSLRWPDAMKELAGVLDVFPATERLPTRYVTHSTLFRCLFAPPRFDGIFLPLLQGGPGSL